MASPAKRVVVHFDVNKTVLFTDIAGGKTLQDVLNSCLADSAWGVLTTNGADSEGTSSPKWVLGSMKLSQKPIPAAEMELLPTGKFSPDTPVFTYTDFVFDTVFPYMRAEKTFSADQRKEVKVHNTEQRRRRRTLIDVFTKPGQPGEALAATLVEMLDTLALPEDKKASCREVSHVFNEGYKFLVPSFYEFVSEVMGAPSATGPEYSLVFRTFGADLPELLPLYNMFCSGTHPLYPGVKFDGTDGTPDLRVEMPHGTGRFMRVGHESSDFFLSSVSDQGLCTVTPGFAAVSSLINKMLQTRRALAFQDHYDWWSANGEVGWAGKPLVIDPSDTSVHHIFFDDNVLAREPKIVDVRDIRTGETMPFEEANGVYLVKVDVVEAIRNPRYFIDAVQRCVEARAARVASSATAGAGSGAASAASGRL